jgi:type VI secretion system protein ImpF
MAELSLKERLQPALFDRLIDDERQITTFQITVTQEALQPLKLAADELLAILRSHGLRLEPADGKATPADTFLWRFTAASGALSPSQLKAFVLKPPGAPQGIALQSFCTIESRTATNEQLEPGGKNMISMRRLRECVQRDLGWLLNSANLAAVQDLARHPFVARSVVNYGMPSMAGRIVTSIDPQVTAQRIRDAISIYEPRLSRIQVIPEKAKHPDEMQLSFRIEAELWGQPLPQHLVLRTSIDVDTGDVRVTEAS